MNLIENPKHYQGKSIDAIRVIDEFNLSFSLGNVVKYILRAKHKGNEVQDLEKAKWYLEHEINRIKPIEVEVPAITDDKLENDFISELNG